jgi:hypothetical protein
MGNLFTPSAPKADCKNIPNNNNNINKPINVEINTALLGIYTFTQGKV